MHTKTPRTINGLQGLVLVRGFLIPIAYIVIIGSTLLATIANEHVAIETLAEKSVSAIVPLVAGIALLTLFHLLYLKLIIRELILVPKAESYSAIGVGAVAAVLLAYVTAGLQVTGANAWTMIPYFLFAIAYGALASHGVAVIRHEILRPREKIRAQLFCVVDWIMTIVCLYLFVRHAEGGAHAAGSSHADARVEGLFLSVVEMTWRMCSGKDLVVGLTLVLYPGAIALSASRLQSRTDKIHAKIVPKVSLKSSVHWDELAAALPGSGCWLDVGAGEGKRTRELMVELGPRCSPSRIMLVERSPKIAESLRASVAKTPFVSIPSAVVRECDFFEHLGMNRDLLDNDIALFSHYAYTIAEARRVVRFMDSFRGKWLVLRFTSAFSFYAVSRNALFDRSIMPYYYHATHAVLLSELTARESWTVLFDRVFAQTVDVSEEDTKKLLVDWCDANYGERAGTLMEGYLRDVPPDAADARSDDRIVVLRRNVEATV